MNKLDRRDSLHHSALAGLSLGANPALAGRSKKQALADQLALNSRSPQVSFIFNPGINNEHIRAM
ncbi:MAG: hypothetical protein HKN87_17675 [Saprospiraceae bacterium]|nr:hypothetical protein [Saprospiraceae bacterium]